MNGEVLKLLPNGNLPPFKPIIFKRGEIIKIPAYSMVFIVVHDTKIPDC